MNNLTDFFEAYDFEIKDEPQTSSRNLGSGNYFTCDLGAHKANYEDAKMGS